MDTIRRQDVHHTLGVAQGGRQDSGVRQRLAGALYSDTGHPITGASLAAAPNSCRSGRCRMARILQRSGALLVHPWYIIELSVKELGNVLDISATF